MSAAWSQFEQDFLNANSWAQRRDGYPGDLLNALSPEERTRAGSLLREKLDGRDSWPIKAMAQLGVTDSVPALRRLLDTVRLPSTRAEIATTISELTGDATMEQLVAAVATSREMLWMVRLEAVHCLARFKTTSAHHVLCDLTHDPEYLVAYNAKQLGGRS